MKPRSPGARRLAARTSSLVIAYGFGYAAVVLALRVAKALDRWAGHDDGPGGGGGGGWTPAPGPGDPTGGAALCPDVVLETEPGPDELVDLAQPGALEGAVDHWARTDA